MSAVFAAGGLVLFVINKKWSRIALLCLVPVCAITMYLTSDVSINAYAALTGITIIAASPLIETLALKIAVRCRSKRTETLTEAEDDILDNKTKWRLIIAGYVVFILFAVFSIISIIRLNAKINTLYSFTQELDQRIEEASDTGK